MTEHWHSCSQWSPSTTGLTQTIATGQLTHPGDGSQYFIFSYDNGIQVVQSFHVALWPLSSTYMHKCATLIHIST